VPANGLILTPLPASAPENRVGNMWRGRHAVPATAGFAQQGKYPVNPHCPSALPDGNNIAEHPKRFFY